MVRLDYYDSQVVITIDDREVSRMYFNDDVSQIGESIVELCEALGQEVESHNLCRY